MYKRILSMQDISCVGQCSMTVALPILSACGHETCLLPTALLSTHTAHGFEGFTFRDLSGDVPAVTAHWQSVGISFDALVVGYLGSTASVGAARQVKQTLCPHGPLILDPAMADNGRLYTGFDASYVAAMQTLADSADVLLPNLTEACLLTDTPYPAGITPETSGLLMDRLTSRYPRAAVVLTGAPFAEDAIGVLTSENGTRSGYAHARVNRSFHGTGDVFTSVFAGAYLRGRTLSQSARLAADFTLRVISATAADPAHWYGVKFEPELGRLAACLDG